MIDGITMTGLWQELLSRGCAWAAAGLLIDLLALDQVNESWPQLLCDDEQNVVRESVRAALLEILEDPRTFAHWHELFAHDRATLEQLAGQFVQDRLAETMTVAPV